MLQNDGCLLCTRLMRACFDSTAEVLRLGGELRRAGVAGDEIRVATLASQSLAAKMCRSNACAAARDHLASVHVGNFPQSLQMFSRSVPHSPQHERAPRVLRRNRLQTEPESATALCKECSNRFQILHLEHFLYKLPICGVQETHHARIGRGSFRYAVPHTNGPPCNDHRFGPSGHGCDNTTDKARYPVLLDRCSRHQAAVSPGAG